jgi:hypothetical protein
MGKALVRISVILVSVYFMFTLWVAQTFGKDISSDWYATLFALIIVVYAYSEGVYHCRYLKYTAVSIFLCDLLTRLDNTFNFLSVDAHNLIPIWILGIGITTSCTLAIRHFIQVLKLKREVHAHNARNTR